MSRGLRFSDYIRRIISSIPLFLIPDSPFVCNPTSNVMLIFRLPLLRPIMFGLVKVQRKAVHC